MSDNFRSKIVLSPGAPQVSSDRLAMEPGPPQWWKRCWGNSCTSGTAGEGLVPKLPVAREADHCVGPGAALSGSSFLSPWSRTALLGNLSQARGRFWKLGKL